MRGSHGCCKVSSLCGSDVRSSCVGDHVLRNEVSVRADDTNWIRRVGVVLYLCLKVTKLIGFDQSVRQFGNIQTFMKDEYILSAYGGCESCSCR